MTFNEWWDTEPVLINKDGQIIGGFDHPDDYEFGEFVWNNCQKQITKRIIEILLKNITESELKSFNFIPESVIQKIEKEFGVEE